MKKLMNYYIYLFFFKKYKKTEKKQLALYNNSADLMKRAI